MGQGPTAGLTEEKRAHLTLASWLSSRKLARMEALSF